jgi:hypothetical protein
MATCGFIKSNGEGCRRNIAEGETRCWQHAKTWRHKYRSLTRDQSVIFYLTLVGTLVALLGVPQLYQWWTGKTASPPEVFKRQASRNPTDYDPIWEPKPPRPPKFACEKSKPHPITKIPHYRPESTQPFAEFNGHRDYLGRWAHSLHDEIETLYVKYDRKRVQLSGLDTHEALNKIQRDVTEPKF